MLQQAVRERERLAFHEDRRLNIRVHAYIANMREKGMKREWYKNYAGSLSCLMLYGCNQEMQIQQDSTLSTICCKSRVSYYCSGRHRPFRPTHTRQEGIFGECFTSEWSEQAQEHGVQREKESLCLFRCFCLHVSITYALIILLPVVVLRLRPTSHVS